MCCPSRVSLLRGQYMHNHGVLSNHPPLGGFVRARKLGIEHEMLPVWLHRVGYRTGMIGKYLNGYSWRKAPRDVPPGWDDWFAVAGGRTYYRYIVNDDGKRRRYGKSEHDYRSDVEAKHAIAFLRRSAAKGQPFFLYWAPIAPHTTGAKGAGPLPPTPAPRHRNLLNGLHLPRVSSLNEEDVHDKPAEIAALPLLGAAEILELEDFYRNRIRSVLAIDEAVERIVQLLDRRGLLDDTYVFLTSDNGFQQGEHRLVFHKTTPYEESIRTPLVVRGPDVVAGAVRSELVLNTDIAPTVADLAGAIPPYETDGRSLMPLLRGQPRVTWRRAFLIEASRNPTATISFVGIRAADAKLIRWHTPPRRDELEIYDLRSDPAELSNVAHLYQPERFLRRLQQPLEELVECAGRSCRAIEESLDGGLETVLVAYPNGNETVRRGSLLPILWADTRHQPVKIEVLLENEVLATIEPPPAARGRFDWLAPADLPVSDGYRIRITSRSNPYISDISDAVFRVVH